MNCIHCNKPIVLVPSDAERARKYGGSPQHYARLFTEHPECALKSREQQTLELMRRKSRHD